MSEFPLVSVVFLNYNGSHLVRKTLPALASTNYERFEIIVVDNASTDDSMEVITQIMSQKPAVNYSLVKNNRNLGYSGGNNSAISFARGKYVVLLSNDVEVHPEWMKHMVNFLENNPNVGVAQSMMYDAEHRNEPDKMGNYIDYIGYCHGFEPSEKAKRVFYSEGAVMWIRRELIEPALGLFDDSYFALYEDIDFCWRIRLMGYDIMVVPTSIVFHTRGSTMKGIIMKTNPLLVYTNTRNRLVTLYKNYGTTNAIKYIPLTMIFEFAKAVWLLFHGQTKQCTSTLKGICSFVLSIPKLHVQRRKVQRIRRVNDRDVINVMYDLKKSLRKLNESKGMIN